MPIEQAHVGCNLLLHEFVWIREVMKRFRDDRQLSSEPTLLEYYAWMKNQPEGNHAKQLPFGYDPRTGKSRAPEMAKLFEKNTKQQESIITTRPRLAEVVGNFLVSLGSFIKHKKKFAPLFQIIQRRKTCESCEYHLDFMKTKRCAVCGCFTKIKTKLAHESCPLRKW